MSISENKELVLGFFDDIAKGNIQGALDRMTEDLRFTLIGTTRFSGVSKVARNLSIASWRPWGPNSKVP